MKWYYSRTDFFLNFYCLSVDLLQSKVSVSWAGRPPTGRLSNVGEVLVSEITQRFHLHMCTRANDVPRTCDMNIPVQYLITLRLLVTVWYSAYQTNQSIIHLFAQ